MRPAGEKIMTLKRIKPAVDKNRIGSLRLLILSLITPTAMQPKNPATVPMLLTTPAST